MFLKYDNTSILETFYSNWFKNTLNDDAIFVTSCVIEAFSMK